MPALCPSCGRPVELSCSCDAASLGNRRRAVEDHNKYRAESSRLGLAYDESPAKEELKSAQTRRLDLREQYGREALARARLFRKVIDIAELRHAILDHLLPGEVLDFSVSFDRLFRKDMFASHLSPLRLVLSGGMKMHCPTLEGYNLSLVAGSREKLLYGLGAVSPTTSKPCQDMPGRHWYAILVATKDDTMLSCNDTFLPLSEFACPGVIADSVEEKYELRGRTVTLKYGSDRMSVWMLLDEQPISHRWLLWAHIYDNLNETPCATNNSEQWRLFCSHGTEKTGKIHGPVYYLDASQVLGESARWGQKPRFDFDVMLLRAGPNNTGPLEFRNIHYYFALPSREITDSMNSGICRVLPSDEPIPLT